MPSTGVLCLKNKISLHWHVVVLTADLLHCGRTGCSLSHLLACRNTEAATSPGYIESGVGGTRVQLCAAHARLGATESEAAPESPQSTYTLLGPTVGGGIRAGGGQITCCATVQVGRPLGPSILYSTVLASWEIMAAFLVVRFLPARARTACTASETAHVVPGGFQAGNGDVNGSDEPFGRSCSWPRDARSVTHRGADPRAHLASVNAGEENAEMRLG